MDIFFIFWAYISCQIVTFPADLIRGEKDSLVPSFPKAKTTAEYSNKFHPVQGPCHIKNTIV